MVTCSHREGGGVCVYRRRLLLLKDYMPIIIKERLMAKLGIEGWVGVFLIFFNFLVVINLFTS